MESFINFYNDILSSNFDKIFFESCTLNIIIIVKKVLKEGEKTNIICLDIFIIILLSKITLQKNHLKNDYFIHNPLSNLII